MPFGLFETTLVPAVKLFLVLASYAVIIPVVKYVHQRYAHTFVKVFHCEYDVAARIVQRTLNAHRVPFRKRTEDEEVIFDIRTGEMRLTVEFFPINMMLDSHIKAEPGAKLTLLPETSENADVMYNVRSWLDEAFAAQRI